jgi:hypothetical protein
MFPFHVIFRTSAPAFLREREKGRWLFASFLLGVLRGVAAPAQNFFYSNNWETISCIVFFSSSLFVSVLKSIALNVEIFLCNIK